MSEPGVPLSETPELTYLGRLLDALELVAASPGATSYRDAARRLGLPSSTVHRILTLLMERGYCERDEAGRFRAGSRLFGLSTQVLAQLTRWQAAQHVVDDLASATGESASFGVLVGREILLAARRNSTHVLAAVAQVGDTLSPHTSAMGKAILACLPPALRVGVVERYASGDADKILWALEEELASIDSAGYSVDEEDYAPGMRCRAVRVVDPRGGLIGGLSVSGPSVRFTAELAEAAIPLLREAAERLVTRTTSSAGAPDDSPDPDPATH